MFARFKDIFLKPKKNTLREKFSLIYARNSFGGKESRSGTGSGLEQTAKIRRLLPGLLKELDIQVFLDAPCGDLFWIGSTPLGVKKYIGMDIVTELIDKNQRERGDGIHEFRCCDLTQDELPCADMIFCRDCLVHLNFADINRALLNFKRSGTPYLLTTTFFRQDRNIDLVGNEVWRALNLQMAPFNFPPPLKLIVEGCSEDNGKYADKSLGLWRLSEMEISGWPE